MKKVMFLTIAFGLMMAFTVGVSAQEKATEVGTGRVMLIYNASELEPKTFDEVITRTKTGNGDHGEKKGIQYNELELKQGNKAMYISYSINTGAIRDLINNKDVTVFSSGGSGVRRWKTEDKVSIQTQPASGGGTEVTFKGVSYFFTFIVKSTAKPNAMEFVKIPAGSFQMGSPTSDELRREDEGPQRKVTLSKDFYMGKTEVTQEQYENVMGSNPSFFKGCPKCPVETVSWDDAQEFIKKLNAKNEGVYRLPTEAEWEYAARAGTTGQYAGSLDAMAWYVNNSGGKTHEVATKQPNAWGLYDMHGNVFEWTSDFYGIYPSGSSSDPTGAKSGSNRVIRGGSWINASSAPRSAWRVGDNPSARSQYKGFRLVRN